MELYEAMRTNPSVRDFTDEPVPDETLYRILEHARFAPSGGNRQGWRVIVVRDHSIREAMRDLYAPGWNEYLAQARAGLVPFAPITDEAKAAAAIASTSGVISHADDFAGQLDRVPVMLVLCADLRMLACSDKDLDRYPIVGGASVYTFAQNILLSARNEGLGGVLTTMLCRSEPKARDILRLPKEYVIAALIALGHPKRQLTKLKRMPVEGIAMIDRFDGEPFTASTGTAR